MPNNLHGLVFTVTEDDAGRAVGDMLRGQGFSHTLLRRVKRAGAVHINGVFAYMRDRVGQGDTVVVQLPPDGSSTFDPEDIPINILFEDAALLAVNKPAGMLVHPVRHEQHSTLANAVLYYWLKKGVKARFRPVYRIDRDTSGIVLVAGDHFTAQQLAYQLESGGLRRRYLAVVRGIPGSGGTIDLPLGLKNGCAAQWEVSLEGKEAVTHFKLVRALNGASLVSLELETGRTHQIRVHMSYIGHPLVGDTRYGEPSDLLGRQALHAAAVDCVHPRTGLPLKLRCPLPEDMRSLISNLSS